MADGFTFDNTQGSINYGGLGLAFNSDGSLSSTSQLKLPSGTLNAPSLTHLNDTVTGLYFPTNDAVGITGNGTEIVRFDGTTGAGQMSLTCGQMYVPSGLAIYTNGGSNGLDSNGPVSIYGTLNVLNGKMVINNTGVQVNQAYYLPANTGTSGQVITSDGAGNTKWSTPSSGGSSGTDPLTYYNMGFM